MDCLTALILSSLSTRISVKSGASLSCNIDCVSIIVSNKYNLRNDGSRVNGDKSTTFVADKSSTSKYLQSDKISKFVISVSLRHNSVREVKLCNGSKFLISIPVKTRLRN